MISEELKQYAQYTQNNELNHRLKIAMGCLRDGDFDFANANDYTRLRRWAWEQGLVIQTRQHLHIAGIPHGVSAIACCEHFVLDTHETTEITHDGTFDDHERAEREAFARAALWAYEKKQELTKPRVPVVGDMVEVVSPMTQVHNTGRVEWEHNGFLWCFRDDSDNLWFVSHINDVKVVDHVPDAGK